VEPGRPVEHGQIESIREDIPLMSDAIDEITGGAPQTWIGHSWGGVLMSSTMAYNHGIADRISSLVLFGSKKEIQSRRELPFIMKVGIPWTVVSPVLARWFGYLPAKRLIPGAATDGETLTSLSDCNDWVYNDHWVDPNDGFDYEGEYNKLIERRGGIEHMPPTWHIAGIADSILGRVDDVQKFANKAQQTQKFTLLAKKNGNLEDYDHGSMLTSRKAVDDHFPDVREWCWQHATTKQNVTERK